MLFFFFVMLVPPIVRKWCNTRRRRVCQYSTSDDYTGSRLAVRPLAKKFPGFSEPGKFFGLDAVNHVRCTARRHLILPSRPQAIGERSCNTFCPELPRVLAQSCVTFYCLISFPTILIVRNVNMSGFVSKLYIV